MRILTDTHILIWALEESPLLPKEARRLLTSRSSEIFISMASIWEIAVKASSGKLSLKSKNLEEEITEYGGRILDIQFKHCQRIQSLPDIHRDPFDRMLIAQSELEHMQLLTTDATLGKYGPHVRVV